MQQIPERPHVVRKSAIAVSRFRFGAGDCWVDRDRLIVRKKPDELQDMPDGFARLVTRKHDIGHDNSSRVDERVARNAALMFELNDRIEC